MKILVDPLTTLFFVENALTPQERKEKNFLTDFYY